MATIEKRTGKTGTFYRVRIRVQGLPEIQKNFTRRTDARIWAEQTQAAIFNGEYRQLRKPVKGYTLANVIEQYRDDIVPDKAVSSQRAQQSYLKFWKEAIGSYALIYIRPELINDKLKALAKADAKAEHLHVELDTEEQSISVVARTFNVRSVSIYRCLNENQPL